VNPGWLEEETLDVLQPQGSCTTVDPSCPALMARGTVLVPEGLPVLPASHGNPMTAMSPKRPGRVLTPALLILLAACGGEAPESRPSQAPALVEALLGDVLDRIPDPAVEAPQLVEALESLLLQDTGVILPFRVQAEGAFEAALEGSLQLASGGRARLDAQGTFGGLPVQALLVSDGRRMIWVNNGNSHEGEAPLHLREGLVLGLSRMGILHNLARLVNGSPPDATDGTAQDWVQITDLAHAGSDPSEPIGVAVHFGIVVGGSPSGDATLWMDPESGVPLLRRQEVSFPEGKMRVTERYAAPMADVEVMDSLFVVPSADPSGTQVSGAVVPVSTPHPPGGGRATRQTGSPATGSSPQD